MLRHVSAAALALGALWLLGTGATAQGKQEWGTLKGRIVWGGKDLPKRQPVNITVDKDHCLAKGQILDEDLVVNPKNKGVKWVAVWLVDDMGNPPRIHPDLKQPKDKSVALDQPMCMFLPRMLTMREGQLLVVKNSAPVNHNIQWLGDPDFNESGNVTLPPGKEHPIKTLKAQPMPVLLQCNVHPWMRGRLMVFSHPYYAVTDADGNFEIKMAPAGKYRLVAWQERVGWRGGKAPPPKKDGGQSIQIKAGGTTDLGELPIGK